MDIKRLYKWAGDIVLTHQCNQHCAFCCDKFVHQYDDVVKYNDVVNFLNFMADVDAKHKEIHDIMLLGGEPTMVDMRYLQEICMTIHEDYGWKVSLTTNGRIGEKILELDGYVDYLNISYYPNKLDDAKMAFTKAFKKSELVFSKLIINSTFPTFTMFDRFVLEAKELGYDFKYSTLNVDSLNMGDEHPAWVDADFLPLFASRIEPIFETCKGLMYEGSVIKLMHLCDGESGFPKLLPNGKITRTWANENGLTLDQLKAFWK